MPEELPDKAPASDLSKNVDSMLRQYPQTLTPDIENTWQDKAAAAGISLLDFPGVRPAGIGLLHLISGHPSKEIDKTLNEISAAHPAESLLGTAGNVALSYGLVGPAKLAGAALGAAEGASNVVKEAWLGEDPVSIEKAISEIGGSAATGLLLGSTGPAAKEAAGVAKTGLKYVEDFVAKHGTVLGGLYGGAKELESGDPWEILKGAAEGAVEGKIAQASVAKLGHHVHEFNEKLESGLFRLFESGSQKAAGVIARAPLSSWEHIVTGVEKHDEEKHYDYISQYLKDHPANIVAGAQARSQAAVGFMKRQIAANRPATMGLPMDDPYEPNDTQKSKIVNSAHAIQHPLSILDDPSPEGIAAVTEVYPALMQLMTHSVVNKVAETKEMPYEVRNKVSMVLGQSLDTTQTPEFGAHMSQMFAQQAKQEAQKQGKPQKGSARAQKAIEQSQKAILTTAQRLQEED